MLRSALAAMNVSANDVGATYGVLGRVGQPEDISQAVLWLCPARAGFVTGHVMSVDVGFLAR
jgi:NAD(P)-dependent dehydrogenase (short-subunit alcohol dehydrogenase family)